MITEPYDVHELQNSQWLVSQLELFLLEHGFSQQAVNAWILSKMLEPDDTNTTNTTEEGDSHE